MAGGPGASGQEGGGPEAKEVAPISHDLFARSLNSFCINTTGLGRPLMEKWLLGWLSPSFCRGIAGDFHHEVDRLEAEWQSCLLIQ